ncbi:TniQ family protein [Brevundimonas naejangsanensis]|uniref:TniQ family protein n=1 Tax=Brevundimonas naejangsanensis TaxID=588932 RepID=UPI0004626377|nr:TniQ family protein [Brevundimonas naejangsanensis]
MGFDRPHAATLSFPRVAPEKGEALSSWLARIARAHLLDLDHVGDEIGCAVQLVDHAPSDSTVTQIGRRTAVDFDRVRAAVHPLLTSLDRPVRGELDWRVCPACLTEDVEAGRAPHLRVAWVHPLSTVCLKHRSPLQIPTDLQAMAMLPMDVALPRQDHGLTCVRKEPLDSFLLAASLVDPAKPASPDLETLVGEIRDLVDALSVQMNFALGRGAALTLFEQPRRDRHIAPMALTLPDGLMTGLDPADRLLFARAAIALRWPSPGYHQEREVLGDWFSRVVAVVVPKGRRRVIADCGMDPLGLLAVALPAQPFHQLRRRAKDWSEDMRARWSRAEQLAALAGLN